MYQESKIGKKYTTRSLVMKRKKKSNVDKHDDIAMKIAIVEANIAQYNSYIETHNDKFVPALLRIELENLEELKQQHPEYFI